MGLDVDRTILFRIDLLAAVGTLGDPSGGEIQELLESPPYNRERVRMNRIYTNLSDLIDDGLVEKEGETGREKSYSLTAEGWGVLETRLEIMERALRDARQ